MSLVRYRQAHRRYAAEEARELRRRRLLVGFAAFVHLRRGTQFQPAHCSLIAGWFQELDVSLARAASVIRRTGSAVRACAKRDRLQYLAQLQERVSRQEIGNSKELFQALRQVFPQARSARRSGHRPLPAVLLPDGTFATSQADRLVRWGEHFAEQEAGFPVTDEEYQSLLCRQKAQARRHVKVKPSSTGMCCRRCQKPNVLFSRLKSARLQATMVSPLSYSSSMLWTRPGVSMPFSPRLQWPSMSLLRGGVAV